MCLCVYCFKEKGETRQKLGGWRVRLGKNLKQSSDKSRFKLWRDVVVLTASLELLEHLHLMQNKWQLVWESGELYRMLVLSCVIG